MHTGMGDGTCVRGSARVAGAACNHPPPELRDRARFEALVVSRPKPCVAAKKIVPCGKTRDTLRTAMIARDPECIESPMLVGKMLIGVGTEDERIFGIDVLEG